MPSHLTLNPEVRGALTVYRVEGALELGVDAFITSRVGGVSSGPYESLNLGDHVGDDLDRVRENRHRVATAAGVDALTLSRQVHGDQVIEVRHHGDADGIESDGLFTSSSAVALAMLVADCVPVLLVDAASKDFAVVHAGWRGLRAGVLARALARFSLERNLHAFLGPAIGADRYQVGPEVASAFTHVAGAVLADTGDRSRLDLHRIGVHQLLELGLDDVHIHVCTETTSADGAFFSDRAVRPCGRFALVAKRVVT